jgi:hypothetical protein
MFDLFFAILSSLSYFSVTEIAQLVIADAQ